MALVIAHVKGYFTKVHANAKLQRHILMMTIGAKTVAIILRICQDVILTAMSMSIKQTSQLAFPAILHVMNAEVVQRMIVYHADLHMREKRAPALL